MLDVIREGSKGWIAKAILVLISVPFALFGIDSYFRDAGNDASIAEVGGQTISVQEFSNQMQNLRKKLQAEGKTDPAILDSPEVKQSVLDRLVNDKLIAAEVKNNHFNVSDEQLTKYVTSLPEFNQDGHFSQELYDQILSQNKLSASRFENMMKEDLKAQQARQGFASLVYQPKSLSHRVLEVANQSREVTVAELKTKDFVSQVTVDAAEVKAYYDKNKEKFRTPEQVKLQFALLSANNLVRGMNVPEEEVKAYFSQNADKFQGDEQRRASHILIGFGVSPTPQAKADARKKAESVLAEVNKVGAKFDELAKKYSQDPGSAQKGGDLGMFARGAMVKSFDEAVFSMKPGEVSGLVESEFGYHIIKLTEIQGASQSYESVKPQILGELMYQKAITKFSEQAEDFTNMVYEQSDSLEPVAKAFGLELQKTEWMSPADAAKFFKNNQKMVAQIFSDEAIKDHRNTEAIEAAPNSLISARVLEHKPAAPRSFDEVKAAIEDALKLQKAAVLAKKKGETALADLQQGKADASIEWIPPVNVTRKDAQGLTELAMSKVFKINAAKLPAYAGVEDAVKGYLLIKVSKVETNAEATANAEAEGELQAALGSEYIASYLKSLKAKSKVTVNQKLLATSNTN